MRKVFSSHRLENVEAVAELLRAADVEVKISGGRGFQGSARSNFSYRDAELGKAIPAVWVLQADDYKPAREVLEKAGLLGMATATSLPRNHPGAAVPVRSPGGSSVAARIRIGLIFATIVLALITAQRSCQRTAPADAPIADRSAQNPAASAGPQEAPQSGPQATRTQILEPVPVAAPNPRAPTDAANPNDPSSTPQNAIDSTETQGWEPEPDTEPSADPSKNDGDPPPKRRERIIPIELPK